MPGKQQVLNKCWQWLFTSGLSHQGSPHSLGPRQDCFPPQHMTSTSDTVSLAGPLPPAPLCSPYHTRSHQPGWPYHVLCSQLTSLASFKAQLQLTPLGKSPHPRKHSAQLTAAHDAKAHWTPRAYCVFRPTRGGLL